MIKLLSAPLALALGGVLALTAAGCAGQAEVASSPPAPTARSLDAPQVHPRWRSCAGEPSVRDDAVTPPRLADTFRPVAAVICGEETQRRPDGGTDAVAVEDRADEVAALLAALRLPLEPPRPLEPPQSLPSARPGPPATAAASTGCTADGYLPPRLVVLDARGRWVRPGVPLDACGKPRAEFTAALKKLRWTRLTTRVLQEVESAEAAASGCGQALADMIWTSGLHPATRRADLAPLAEDAAPVRLCVYRVPASEQRGDKPRGDFVSGGWLPPGRWAAAKREIRASGAATACTTPAHRFALLETPQGDVYAELDGCRRLLAPAVLPGDGTSFDVLRQAPAALSALLAG